MADWIKVRDERWELSLGDLYCEIVYAGHLGYRAIVDGEIVAKGLQSFEEAQNAVLKGLRESINRLKISIEIAEAYMQQQALAAR